MPFYVTVDDVVYSLCMKVPKKSLSTKLKVTAIITWFNKKRTQNETNKTVTPSSYGRYYSRSLEKDILLIFLFCKKIIRYQFLLLGFRSLISLSISFTLRNTRESSLCPLNRAKSLSCNLSSRIYFKAEMLAPSNQGKLLTVKGAVKDKCG